MSSAAILLVISMSIDWGPVVNFKHDSFFSAFSLRALVERTSSRSGLDCSAGGTGGGIGSVGGGVGGKESRQHKAESLSCRVKSGTGEQFNEAEYLASLRAVVEEAITASGAKIIGGKALNAGGFYYEYSMGKTLGHIDITWKRVGNDHYSLKASLDEIAKKEE